MKRTRIEIRDVGFTFSFSFNGVAQCTTDTGHVLHARTVPCVFVILDCNSLHTDLFVFVST